MMSCTMCLTCNDLYSLYGGVCIYVYSVTNLFLKLQNIVHKASCEMMCLYFTLFKWLAIILEKVEIEIFRFRLALEVLNQEQRHRH